MSSMCGTDIAYGAPSATRNDRVSSLAPEDILYHGLRPFALVKSHTRDSARFSAPPLLKGRLV
eukprot:509611-Rhodomonas_salina.1